MRETWRFHAIQRKIHPVRLLAVSCDLDEIPNYHQIHGLGEPSDDVRSLVYDVALPRLLELARESYVPLTLFAIGADLARQNAAKALAAASDAGHEIANHTQDHMYEFSRLTKAGIRTQVEGGIRAILDATGQLPKGFRAPGYVINQAVFDVLEELGVTYDSSVFPCPLYFAAKAAALARIAAAGRTSHSVVDTPNVLKAPVSPYRIGKPYWTQGTGLIELPVQVTRGARLPFIGTSITLAGVTGAKLLARMCVGMPLVNLELHGIDLLDASDGLDALTPYQPDVRVRVQSKLEALRAVFEVFRYAGYEAVTLADAAQRMFS